MNRHDPEQLNNPAVSQEYTLESIMREFGTQEEKKSEAPSPSHEDVKLAEPKHEEIKLRTNGEPSDEPIKIHTPTPKPKKRVSDDTMVFKPIRTEQPTPDLEAPMKIVSDGNLPTAKQNSAKDTPAKKPTRRERKIEREERRIGEIKDCAPPSAQQELKKCKQGLGMRHLRVFLMALPVLVGLFLILYAENGWTFLPFVQSLGYLLPLILLLIACFLSYDVFLTALLDLLRLRIGLHTLTSVAAVLTILHTITQGSNDPQSYCAITAFLLFSQLRALHNRDVAQFHTLRTVCSFDSPMGIYDTPKLLENTDSLRRDKGNTADFLEKLAQKNRPQTILRVYSTAIFILAPVIAYIFSISRALPLIQVWLLILLGAIPGSAALAFVHPFAALAKRLSAYHSALCGWYGAKVFGRKHTIVISDEDLFPKKNITSNGMKLYGTHKAPRIIACALAALKLVDSPLVDLFQSLLETQYGKQLPVTQHRIYSDGGIGAEIAGDIVLVGSLSFMRSMGVHMPAGTRVRQAVYVSVGGELAGIFAVKYKPSASSKAGLRDILANRNFSVVLATRDFLISPELIAAKYELATDCMQFPDYEERLRLSQDAPKESARQGALIAKDSFGAFAVTVAAGRTLRLNTTVCLTLGVVAGLLGFLLCTCLLAWNAVSVASPLHIAAFQLLWSILSAFISFMILKF